MELKKVIVNVKRLYKNYVKKRLWRVFAALFFSVIIASTTSATAWLLDPAVKKIFMDNDRTFAVLIPIAIIIVFAAKGASLYAARSLILVLGYRVIQEIQGQMAGHILLSDTQSLESKHSGRHITSFMYDVAQIQPYQHRRFKFNEGYINSNNFTCSYVLSKLEVSIILNAYNATSCIFAKSLGKRMGKATTAGADLLQLSRHYLPRY